MELFHHRRSHEENLEHALQVLLSQSRSFLERIEYMSKALDDLTAQVTASIAAEQAAIAAVQAGANDSAALADLTAKLKASNDALAAAVAAATPPAAPGA